MAKTPEGYRTSPSINLLINNAVVKGRSGAVCFLCVSCLFCYLTWTKKGIKFSQETIPEQQKIIIESTCSFLFFCSVLS